jgi:hypothetical protein
MFRTSPIIVGTGGAGGSTAVFNTGIEIGGIGCGGGAGFDGVGTCYGGVGGNGLAVIITW